MNPIEFTKEHEDKLLEMCRNLFPEYEHIQVRNYYSMSDYVFQPTKPDGKDNDGLFAIEFLTKKEYKQSTNDFDGIGYSIAVFEFCMTHLTYKLIDELKKNQQDKEVDLFFRFNSKFHIYGNDLMYSNPIDYLYEQFKQLK